MLVISKGFSSCVVIQMNPQIEQRSDGQTDESGQLRNRKKSSREPIVRFLSEDDPEFLSFLSHPKAKDAVWVKGLSEQDELEEIEFLKMAKRAKEEKAAKFLVVPLGRDWLCYPNILGVAFVVVLLASLFNDFFLHGTVNSSSQLNRQDEIQYIYSTDTFFPLMKRRGEGVVEFFFRVSPIISSFPMLFASLYALCLALIVGISTHHFSALCGVGCAVLYFLAATSQYYITSSTAGYLFRVSAMNKGSTKVRESSFTDVAEELLALYYLTMIVKYLSPMISVILVCPSVALAMGRFRLSRPLCGFLSIPLFLCCGHLFSPLFSNTVEGIRSPFISLTLVYGAMLVSWGAFIWLCLRHKNFELPYFSPPILD